MSTPYEPVDPNAGEQGGQPTPPGVPSPGIWQQPPQQGWPAQPSYPPPGYPSYQPPGYQQPGYQQPGYQQPGYQPGYQQPGYPAPGYPSYPGYPPTPPGSGRPGAVIASAILAYVDAGLLIIAGLLLFFGASTVSGLSDAFGSSHNGTVAELVFDGLINLLAAGLQIAGGVMVTGRDTRGRRLLAVGSGLCICAGIYWLIRASTGGVVPWTLLYVAPAVIALVLIYQRPVSQWFAGHAPAPAGPYGY